MQASEHILRTNEYHFSKDHSEHSSLHHSDYFTKVFVVVVVVFVSLSLFASERQPLLPSWSN